MSLYDYNATLPSDSAQILIPTCYDILYKTRAACILPLWNVYWLSSSQVQVRFSSELPSTFKVSQIVPNTFVLPLFISESSSALCSRLELCLGSSASPYVFVEGC